MSRMEKVKQSLEKEEFRKSQVKAVEKELGLPQPPRLDPEMRALYKAIFRKVNQPQPQEEAPPTPVI